MLMYVSARWSLCELHVAGDAIRVWEAVKLGVSETTLSHRDATGDEPLLPGTMRAWVRLYSHIESMLCGTLLWHTYLLFSRSL